MGRGVGAVSTTGSTGSAVRLQVVRWVVLALAAAFFVVPLLAMLDFSTRTPTGGRSGADWAALLDSPPLVRAILASVQLAALTALAVIALLLPTMLLVTLRLPWARRAVEFLCLLPLAVPAIVVVVGIAPVYAWVTYFFGGSSLTLVFAYVVLALPFAHRALDAGLRSLDVITLVEAARSLGARWPTVLLRVLLPNLRGAVLSAAFLTVALVLGEFTFASLLSYDTLPVAINAVGKRDAGVSVAASLALLLVAFALLLALSLLPGPGARARRRRPLRPSPTFRSPR